MIFSIRGRCADPQAAAVEVQNLQPVAKPIRKQEQMAAERIELESACDKPMQSRETQPHVGCARGHINPRCRAQNEHRELHQHRDETTQRWLVKILLDGKAQAIGKLENQWRTRAWLVLLRSNNLNGNK